MFRHQGKSRTQKHNLRIASVLSFVAGLVNVTGYLAIQRLTTNVTGHFAFFINDVSKLEFWKGTIYLLYILSFLLGSFVSSLFIELMHSSKRLNIFVLPTLLESTILILVALLADFNLIYFDDLFACMLLFAMGVQNSFVTKISNAIVRTTHLTGLFTDLGIELSQLFYPKKYPLQSKIISTIKLRLDIIFFFFFGGIVGGILYTQIQYNALIFGALVLITGLIYDNLKFRMILVHRKYKNRKAVVYNN